MHKNAIDKHTKIVATLGPSSQDAEVIRRLIQEGMNVARINFSHGTHDTHLQTIETVRRVASEEQVNIAILSDIQGPKIRIGRLTKPLQLEPDDTVIMTQDESADGTGNRVTLAHPEFMRDIAVGTNLLLDDGNLEFKVSDIVDSDLVCEVIIGGSLSSNKGVSAPNSKLTLDAITEKDIEDIHFALDQETDYIALSFVRSAHDIEQLHTMMKERNQTAGVIAKIEMREALENIESIIAICDGIMVARGDLGIETPAERVPVEQKRIIDLCNRAAKPVITATQMLESMRQNPRPTRAEASDVFNAIMDGTDAVMLSAESASGKYPVESVHMMAQIAITAEDYFWSNREELSAFDVQSRHEGEHISNAISEATYHIAEELNPTAIITTTMSGYTTRRVARERPRAQILCMTPNERVFRKMALVWGVNAVLVPEFKSIDDMLNVSSRAAYEQGMVRNGDIVVIIAGVPFGVKGQTNMLKVHVIDVAG